MEGQTSQTTKRLRKGLFNNIRVDDGDAPIVPDRVLPPERVQAPVEVRGAVVSTDHDVKARHATLPSAATTIARIRRWLSRPRGEYNVETKSFFGSFVSLFVNDRIGSAERVLRVRSQDVESKPWP